jgi:hypothetical protein
MKKLLRFFLFGTAAYCVWRALRAQRVIPGGAKLVTPLPAGAELTGKSQITANGRPPDEVSEVIVHDPASYVEVRSRDGKTEWVKVEAL